jgi:RND family efflux transporter MFP subunit
MEPAKKMQLSFKTGGIIQQINAREGDFVKRGQLLAMLDLQEVGAKENQAQMAVDKARRDFERVRNLYNDSVATLEQFQNAETALQVAESDLKIIAFNKRHSSIHAPVDGVILKKVAEKSEVIAAGYPVFVLGTLSQNMKVSAAVTDQEWIDITPNDSAIVTFDVYRGRKFRATVDRIAQMADPYTGTYSIELKFSKPQSSRLGIGMVARATIFPQKTYQFVKIPFDALVQASGLSGFVYVVDDNIVKKQSVEIASLSPTYVYIKRGLSGGEQLAVRGKEFIQDGDTVRVTK